MVRNVVFNGIRLFVLALLPLIMTPVYLGALGAEAFGAWAVFLAAINLTTLADLGLAGTLSKHVAELVALRDLPGLGRLLSAGLAVYAGLAVAIAALVWVAAPLLADVFMGSSALPLPVLIRMWHYAGVIVALNVLGLLFASILVGLQRLDIMSLVNAVSATVAAAISVILLSTGLGLPALVFGTLAGSALALLCYAFMSRTLLVAARPALASVTWRQVRELFSFSLKLHITQIAVAINNQIEKIYLAAFVSVVPVGWYEITTEFGRLRHVPNVIASPLMPAAAELHAVGDSARLAKLFRQAHKYLAMASLPLLGLASLLAADFMSLWVGPELEFLAAPAVVLLAVGLFNVTTGPSFLILVARGDLAPGIRSAVLTMTLNVSLSFFLIRAYGFAGAVVGTSISLGVASLYFHVVARRHLGLPTEKVLSTCYAKPALATLVTFGLARWLTAGTPKGWLDLLGIAAAFGAVYLAILWAMGFFDEDDRQVLEKVRALGR